jgi:hypothetical protein
MRYRNWGLFVLLGILANCAPLSAAEWGNLKGRFVFDGTAPVPAQLVITKDVEYCGQYPKETVDQSIMVGGESGLRNVFVYLKTTDDALPAIHPDYLEAKPVVIDNTHCMFYPHATGLWAGKQMLVVNNNDPIGQAVIISTSKNSPINLLVAPGAKLEHKFDLGETLPKQVTCGVHPWEMAYLLLHNSPYFSVSNETGEFVIRNIPVGEWTFQMWHEKAGYLVAKPEWEKGRVTMMIQPGDNDLGTIKVAPDLLNK